MDNSTIDQLEKKTADLFQAVSKAAVEFLSKNDALAPQRMDSIRLIAPDEHLIVQ